MQKKDYYKVYNIILYYWMEIFSPKTGGSKKKNLQTNKQNNSHGSWEEYPLQ